MVCFQGEAASLAVPRPQEGDCIVGVDDQDVTGCDLGVLRSLIMGRPNTAVILRLRRHRTVYETIVIRGARQDNALAATASAASQNLRRDGPSPSAGMLGVPLEAVGESHERSYRSRTGGEPVDSSLYGSASGRQRAPRGIGSDEAVEQARKELALQLVSLSYCVVIFACTQ